MLDRYELYVYFGNRPIMCSYFKSINKLVKIANCFLFEDDSDIWFDCTDVLFNRSIDVKELCRCFNGSM